MVTRNSILERKQRYDSLPFRYKNALLRSPIDYTMLERRALYKLCEEIKKRYNTCDLVSREKWNDFTFYFTSADLAVIGGDRNYQKTFDAILALTKRTIVQYEENEQGQYVFGSYHWISSFKFNEDTKDYLIRVSPELYDYVINVTKNFSSLDLYVALRLKSKYSQKFYEIGCMLDTEQQFFEQDAPNRPLKKRVVQMTMESFRDILGLSELRVPKTNEIVHTEKYKRFEEVRKYVIEKAQKELFNLYKDHKCNIWFDYLPGERTGKGRNGGSPKKIFLFFYTYGHPKSTDIEDDRPFVKGDQPLNPFAEEDKITVRTATTAKVSKTPNKSLSISSRKNIETSYSVSNWSAMGVDTCRTLVKALLDEYLLPIEVTYYLCQIDQEQRRCPDSYAQVMQAIHEKLHQPSFEQGTSEYKRKCIVKYVFQKNLKTYGWSIKPMTNNNTK